jgi:hypothetical protein
MAMSNIDYSVCWVGAMSKIAVCVGWVQCQRLQCVGWVQCQRSQCVLGGWYCMFAVCVGWMVLHVLHVENLWLNILLYIIILCLSVTWYVCLVA